MAATLRVRLPAEVPDAIRELVVGEKRRRNDICWRMFDFSPCDARGVAEIPVEGTGMAVVSPATGTLRDEMAVSGQLLLVASGQIPISARTRPRGLATCPAEGAETVGRLRSSRTCPRPRRDTIGPRVGLAT